MLPAAHTRHTTSRDMWGIHSIATLYIVYINLWLSGWNTSSILDTICSWETQSNTLGRTLYLGLAYWSQWVLPEIRPCLIRRYTALWLEGGRGDGEKEGRGEKKGETGNKVREQHLSITCHGTQYTSTANPLQKANPLRSYALQWSVHCILIFIYYVLTIVGHKNAMFKGMYTRYNSRWFHSQWCREVRQGKASQILSLAWESHRTLYPL